jgi:hypothetical protein
MVSDFLVQHPSGPFFSLSESEYQKALVKYPQLDSEFLVNHITLSRYVRKLNFSLFSQMIRISTTLNAVPQPQYMWVETRTLTI